MEKINWLPINDRFEQFISSKAFKYFNYLNIKKLSDFLQLSNLELNWSVPNSEIVLCLVFIGSLEETNLDLWSTWFLGFRCCLQTNFVTLGRFCPLNQITPTPPPPPLFLTANIKMERIPTKIKWKIHALFTMYFVTFWR